MARRHSFWSVFNATLGGIAAIVTAGTGVYLAMKSDSSPTVMTNVAPPSEADADEISESVDGTVYDRTPWLGVELRQSGKTVPLRSIENAWDRFAAKLDRGPIELHITRTADDPSIGILAWHDDSLFDAASSESLQLAGTGIAGGQFAVPILYLDKSGFNYYNTERLKRIADDKYAVLVTTIGSGELELPLQRFAGPLYLIVFRVPSDFQMTVPSHDFELFVLDRK
jgi:hypothetical protein